MNFSELVAALVSEAHSGVKESSLIAEPQINPRLEKAASINNAIATDLSYVEGSKFAQQVLSTQASALILPLDEALQQQAIERGIAWVSSSNPRMTFAIAIALFYQPFQPEAIIHPRAVIHPTAQLGKNVAIGANVVIHSDAVIGDYVKIHPNVVVYPNCTIGDRTILHANCVIHERSQIGSDCTIHSGAAIGSEGFGFVPTQDGWVKMEQSGYTLLEDGVEVGCNSTIDRPAVGETRIKRQTKIDNLVQIGHGGTVGEGCAFAAQVGLAGGVTVGDRVILAGQVGVANQVKIGSGTTATARAGIISNIDGGATVSGHPTIPHRTWLKQVAIQKKLPDYLPDLQGQIKALQDQVADLQRRLAP
ncbi:MAG: UDP-3-O-(3-hydroxymyristoyl)glucosamine N-acyltransferase [Cyanobacteria bacterium P01_F01_bin.150]